MYPENIIYSAIEQRITDNEAWLTGLGGTAVADIQWYNKQYEEQQNDLPWLRPAVFIEFAEIDWVHHTAFTQKCNVPIALHIVQDLYVDGRDSSPQLNDFKTQLDYPYMINELFDGWKGSGTCFKRMKLVRTRTDHDNDNLMVHVFVYESEVVLNKLNNPPD
ncbi:hypothetical protein C900_05373 [Fulvivirga imtechensis AK7]|uniref:Uncharacterized protein n=1 Tax=Fulvivirga imtechensis AK7 TaxID=1237149 RepID=L8JP64_9BACT|nr:hypothetical protein [Fulvivirga imtechensis]ELR69177.1 hypothetical protein C900_05373 [Fulvivirga imtechensis AK7]